MKNRTRRILREHFVYILSLGFLSILVLMGIAIPEPYQKVTEFFRNKITTNFGWFYLLLVTGILIFCVYLILSPVGQIRLGEPDSEP